MSKKISPVHPGEILLEEFLKPMDLSQNQIAKDIDVPPRRINEIVLGKRRITADTAKRLGKYFKMSSKYWMELQYSYELEKENDKENDLLIHGSYKEKEIVIKDSNQDFDYWLNRPYISNNLKRELQSSEILIIPEEGIREFNIPLFPVKTEEVFTYMRNAISGDQSINICVEDKDYKELALHHDQINIATFIVTSALLPIFINLLSNYIQEKIIKRRSDSTINVKFIVQKKNRESKKIYYEGKPEYFGDTIKSLKEIWND